jgi:hypothetical protein
MMMTDRHQPRSGSTKFRRKPRFGQIEQLQAITGASAVVTS